MYLYRKVLVKVSNDVELKGNQSALNIIIKQNHSEINKIFIIKDTFSYIFESL